MRTFSLVLITLCFLWSPQAHAQIDYSAYFGALNSGQYKEAISVALKSISVTDAENEKSALEAIDFAYIAADDALRVSDFQSYDKIRQLISKIEKNAQIPGFATVGHAIQSDVLFVADPRVAFSLKRETINSLQAVNFSRFLSEENEVRMLVKIANAEMAAGNYTNAEKYLLNALAVAAGRGNVLPATLYELLIALTTVYNDTSRRMNNLDIGRALNALENGQFFSGGSPRIIIGFANVIYTLVEGGYIDNAKRMLSHAEKTISAGIFIPPVAKHKLLYSKALVAVITGDLAFFDNIEVEFENYFGGRDVYLNEAFDVYRLTELYGRLNAGNSLNSSELSQLKKLKVSEEAEIFRDLALFLSEKSLDEDDVVSRLRSLKKPFNTLSTFAISDYQYEKSGNIFRGQVLNLIFRFLRNRYQGDLPANISAALFDLLIEAETSKIDYLYRVNRVSDSFGNNKSIYLVEGYYKLIEEKNLLVSKLIEVSVEKVFAYVARDFVRENNEDDNLSFRFKHIRNYIDDIYQYLQREEGFSNVKIFSPSQVNLARVKERLGPFDDLLFYRMIGNEYVTCIVAHDDHRCRLGALPIAGFQERVEDLYLAASNSPSQDEAFPNPAAEYIYKALLGDYQPSMERTLFIKPQTGHLKIPFRALRSSNWPPGDYLGLRSPVVFLSSFYATERKYFGADFRKKYFAVGNPSYQIETSEQIQMSGLFTIRSAAMAEQLSELGALPDTEREIYNVTKSMRQADFEVLLGKQATELNVRLADMDRFQILHFATHGLISGEFEGLKRPSLAFSLPSEEMSSELEDGLLSSNEIAELKIRAKLVILSACQTVTDYGQPNSVGFDGLTSAFLRAGANAVLATQWKIESSSASTIISNAVDLVLNSSLDPVEANLRATLNISKNDKYRHPFYWAPYILVQGLRPLEREETDRKDLFSIREIHRERSPQKLREALYTTEVSGRVFFTVMDTVYGESRAKSHFGEFRNGKILLKESPYGSLGIISASDEKLIFRGGRFETGGGVSAILGTYDYDTNFHDVRYTLQGPTNSISVFEVVLPIKDGFLIQATIYENRSGKEFWKGYIKVDKKFREVSRIDKDSIASDSLNDRIISRGNDVYRITTFYSDRPSGEYSLKSGFNDCAVNSDVHIEQLDADNMEFLNVAVHKGYQVRSVLEGQRVILEKVCGSGRYYILQPGNNDLTFLIDTPLDIWGASQFFSKSGEEYIFLNSDFRASNLYRFGLPTKYYTGDKIFSKSIKTGVRDVYAPTVLKKIDNQYQIIGTDRGRLTTFYTRAFNLEKGRCGVFSVKQRHNFVLEEFAC
jgi:hypothetical protein